MKGFFKFLTGVLIFSGLTFSWINGAAAYEGTVVPVADSNTNITCDLHNITNPSDCPGPDQWGGNYGVVCCSENDDIAYIRGNMPLILSNPHGGYSYPSAIPNRSEANCGNSGCGGSFDSWHDVRSQEYTREVRRVIYEKIGKYPHVILNRLERIKLDANRNIDQGACGNSRAETAWNRFNQFITFARNEVTNRCGKGLYADFHTMGWNSGWIQLGYLLSSSAFSGSDSTLNGYASSSSFKNLVATPSFTLSQVLRSTDSLGGRMNNYGFNNVFPSVSYPHAPTAASWEAYLNGGCNTSNYSSKYGGTVDGFQIEAYYTLINQDCDNCNREVFARALASSIVDFTKHFYGFSLTGSYGCGTSGSTPSPSPQATKSPTPMPTKSPTPGPTKSPTPHPTTTATSNPTPTSTPGGKPGDVNGDGAVNMVDIGIIIDVYGIIPVVNTKADLNYDNQVNMVDIGIVIDNYGL